MKVLITGGAGFIGSALVRHLAGQGGYEITVLDNLSRQVHGEEAEFPGFLLSSARCLRGSVTVRQHWLEALEGQDAVVHLAAETGTGQSLYESHRYVEVNVLGTALLTDLVQEHRLPLQRIVLASSRAVYGEGCYSCDECGGFQPELRDAQLLERGQFEVRCPGCERAARPAPTGEEARLLPVSVYGGTKLAQEHLLQVLSRSAGIPCTALRFHNVYGPGQSLNNPYTGILSIFSSLILSGGRVEVYEDGQESRDFLFIDDAAEAIRLTLEAGDLPQLAYNVGSGQRCSVMDIARLLAATYGRPVPIEVSGRFRAGDVRHCVADIARLERDTGFRPQWKLQDGIEQLCRWVRSEPIYDSRYEQSAGELSLRGLLRASQEPR